MPLLFANGVNRLSNALGKMSLVMKKTHTVQPGSFSTVGSFNTVDPVVGRICLQCKY